jgi:hypothetical protein
VAITKQNLIDRAVLEAGLDDADAAANALLERAYEEFSKDVAAEPESRGVLIKVFDISLDFDGKESIADDLLIEYLDLASFSGNGINQQETPFNRVPHYADFLSYQLPGFIHFCVANGMIYFRKDNFPYQDVPEFSLHGLRSIVEADLATLPESLEQRLVSKLAGLLRGGA